MKKIFEKQWLVAIEEEVDAFLDIIADYQKWPI